MCLMFKFKRVWKQVLAREFRLDFGLIKISNIDFVYAIHVGCRRRTYRHSTYERLKYKTSYVLQYLDQFFSLTSYKALVICIFILFHLFIYWHVKQPVLYRFTCMHTPVPYHFTWLRFATKLSTRLEYIDAWNDEPFHYILCKCLNNKRMHAKHSFHSIISRQALLILHAIWKCIDISYESIFDDETRMYSMYVYTG